MKTAKKQLSAQDIQDKILFKMPANKSLKLASDFSMFIMMLNKTVNKKNGFSKNTRKNRKNS
ncbi:hypothetical protein KJ633_07470 [bacterium]|nr:hypothetical protein [bacterium]